MLKLYAVIAMLCAAVDGHIYHFRSDYKYLEDFDGWYKVHRIPTDFKTAALRCRLEGTALASPTSKTMVKLIETILGTEKVGNFIYTGFHSLVSSEDYYSEDGSPLFPVTFLSWAAGEPSNDNMRESCIMFTHDGTISDKACSTLAPYVCYWQRDADVHKNDKCGIFDDEYFLNEQTKYCYKFHKIPRQFSEAFMACAAEGAMLVNIDNKEEEQVVKDIFKENPPKSMPGLFEKGHAYIGLNDWNEHGEWLTVTGEPVSATYWQWALDKPSNATRADHCAAADRRAHASDVRCDQPRPFICKKHPSSLEPQIIE